MRDLLDNVQYMPTASRFKVYLIDEVHMLSTASFNAMLKTLEEPPEHVKFLFATTDPKKLPVTVLSRCLQFNLKNLSPERIVNYLKQILPKEDVAYEEAALWQLGRAADGSMRDALSLTDQAISYADKSLTDDVVKTMLGSIDQQEVYKILGAVIDKDGEQLLEKVKSLAQFAPDYSALLDELLGVLHRVAVAQAVPDGIDNSQGDRELVLAVSRSVGQEDIQLFYQIGLIGKRDLTMAPDPRSGFEMILLRMLAFTPNASVAGGSVSGGNSSSDDTVTIPGNNRAQAALDVINGAGKGSAKPVTAADVGKHSKTLEQETEVAEIQAAEATHESSPSKAISAQNRPPETSSPETRPSEARSSKKELSQKEPSRKEPSQDEPAQHASSQEEPSQEEPSQEEPSQEKPSHEKSMRSTVREDWNDILLRLGLSGVTQTLAANCTLERHESNHCHLRLNEHHASLWNKTHESRISQALSRHYNCEMSVSIEIGETQTETPAQLDRRQQEDRQARAVIAIENDENIQALIQNFGGTLNRNSIEPMSGEQQ
jgi:DNA polymerase-3 subunit gamma/tau